jgi:CheY-like chemotaxis protein
MADGLNELEQRLLALKKRMEAGLGQRAQALRDSAAKLEAGDESARKAIKTESHKLRGVAGTYGHGELTERAGELEQRASLSPPAIVGKMARELASLAENTGKQSGAGDAAKPVLSMPPDKHAPKSPVPAAARSLRILAMDDDPLTLRLLSLTLKQVGGFDATIVESANQALELLSRESFDLVLSDAMMPEMNGRELCERARELGAKMPIVILSAASPEELGWSSVLPGPSAWLRKPFKPTELVKAIRRIVLEAG